MLRSTILLFLGVFACSTAAIQLKACPLSPDVISTVRLFFAALILSPIYFLEKRKFAGKFTSAHKNRLWLPAIALAGHFVSWAYGAHITPTAQASLIVNLAPVALPFFLFAMMGERINRSEIIATILTIVGLTAISARDLLSAGASPLGDLVCFLSMLAFAWYLALGRSNRDIPSVWLYVVPVYFRASLICLLISLPRLGSLLGASPKDLLLLAGITIIPTVIGHSLINYCMRTLRGQVVSLANTSQFVFAGVMAWLFFQEVPPLVFYFAAALVLAGVCLAITASPPPKATDDTGSST